MLFSPLICHIGFDFHLEEMVLSWVIKSWHYNTKDCCHRWLYQTLWWRIPGLKAEVILTKPRVLPSQVVNVFIFSKHYENLNHSCGWSENRNIIFVTQIIILSRQMETIYFVYLFWRSCHQTRTSSILPFNLIMFKLKKMSEDATLLLCSPHTW